MTRKLKAAFTALLLVGSVMVAIVATATTAQAFTANTTCVNGLNVSVAAMQTGPSGSAHFGGSILAEVYVPSASVCDASPHPAANQQTISYVETLDNHGDYLLVGFYPDKAGVDSCGAGNESVLTDYNGTIRHNYGYCAGDGTTITLAIEWTNTTQNCYEAVVQGPPTGLNHVPPPPTDLACFGGPGNNAFTGLLDEGVAGQVGYGDDSDMYGDSSNTGTGSGKELFSSIAVDNTSHVSADACTANGSAPANAFNAQTITGTYRGRFDETKLTCDSFNTWTAANP